MGKEKCDMITRPIAISRVLRAFSDRQTNQPTDRQTDWQTYRVACTRLKRAFAQNFMGIVDQVLGQIWGLRLQNLIVIWCLEPEYYFARAFRELHEVWDLLVTRSRASTYSVVFVTFGNLTLSLFKSCSSICCCGYCGCPSSVCC